MLALWGFDGYGLSPELERYMPGPISIAWLIWLGVAFVVYWVRQRRKR